MVKDSWQTACMWMKEKDITQKVLEDNNDIFADIVNVLLGIELSAVRWK